MQLAAAAGTSGLREEVGIDGANRLDRVKRNATVLAETSDRHPLLIASEYGRGRVLAFAGDSRGAGGWAVSKRLTSDSGGKSCCGSRQGSVDRQLGVGQSRRAALQPGTRVEFTAGAHNEHGEPIADATYEVEVLRPDGSKGSPHAACARRNGGHISRSSIAGRLYFDRKSIARWRAHRHGTGTVPGVRPGFGTRQSRGRPWHDGKPGRDDRRQNDRRGPARTRCSPRSTKSSSSRSRQWSNARCGTPGPSSCC